MKRHTQPKGDITQEEFLIAIKDEKRADKLYEDYGVSVLCIAWELYSGGNSLCASYLCKCARTKSAREYINSLADSSKRRALWAHLTSDEPKMRKNTARLIGSLMCPDDTGALIHALKYEKTRFVIPSVILALGSLGTEEAHSALSDYIVAPAKDSAEIKHEREEREALGKALSTFRKTDRHVFIGYGSLPTVKLICAKASGRYMAEDCKRLGITVQSYADSSVRAAGTDEVLFVRSCREILIPVAKGDTDPDTVRRTILSYLGAAHEKSSEPFRYRIEYRGTGDRREEIDRYKTAFNCPQLVNSASDYEAEIRITRDGDIYLKLFTPCDNRFSYRVCALPASIAPANAASVMSFARKYLKENATVLDMCCGSGTMLAERHCALSCKKLIGVDISEKAIECARKNLHSFPAELYRKDLRSFVPKEQVDEVISNLPFGNRVGTHDTNAELYAALFEKLTQWLKVGGICVLYTMEKSLLMRNVKKSGAFELADSCVTEAGGLSPCVIILRRIK